jgi:hypothetical protein
MRFLGLVVDHLEHRDAGVIHQDVDRAAVFLTLSKKYFTSAACSCPPERQFPAAMRFDLCDNSVGALLARAIHDDRGTSLAKCLRGSGSDSFRRARNNGNFSIQLHTITYSRDERFIPAPLPIVEQPPADGPG